MVGIVTQQGKGSALTIDELDINFLSQWQIITGESFNGHTVSSNFGPGIETAYTYAARFNVMAMHITGQCTSAVLWYPNWIASRMNTNSTTAPSASFINMGGYTFKGNQQWHGYFGQSNANIGIHAGGSNNTGTYPAANETHSFSAWGGYLITETFKTEFQWKPDTTQGYGYCSTGSGVYLNYPSFVYRKAGAGLRTSNSTNYSVYFNGSIYLLGLTKGHGYNYSYWQRDNAGT